MAGFKPNTTMYLCAGTGMDASNSIWWQRFAYPTGDPKEQESWWNTCFQWFKAHSIAEGYWQCTTASTTKGFIRVGRSYQNDGSIPSGQSGLGSASKQSELDDPNVPFIEAVRAVDYLIFANDGQSGYVADIQYAFVTHITSVNYSTADIHFTIDAIMTYQKFFHLGRCNIVRDMQFQERDSSKIGYPVLENMNIQPEPFSPSDTDYIFRRLNDRSTSTNLEKLWELGKYDRCFVLTDVDLQANKITPNDFYGGLPSFEPSEFTTESSTNLGVGVYYIPIRKNNAFSLLGSYNAMEHILYTYLVPHNLVKDDFISGTEPIFVQNMSSWISDSFTTGNIKFPNGFSDKQTINSASSDEYLPINLKCYNAPFRYFSITDKQGGSLEIQPQILSDLPNDINNYFKIDFGFLPSIGPNMGSALTITNTFQLRGSEADPMITMWQMPSYSMTPNNSGYNTNFVNAMYQKNMAKEMMVIGGGITIAANSIAFLGKLAGMAVGGEAGMMGMRMGGQAGGDLVGGVAQPYQQIGGGITGGGVTALNASINNIYQGKANMIYGLPKAVGGLPQGYTYLTMNFPGYEIYVVHWKTYLIKQLDLAFSMYGYMQNAFRYPHINIRKRWCYTKTADVNIIPQSANNYISGGIPFAMREQIEQRLSNGITWWNLRQGLMGDNDRGASDVQSYTDPRIQNTIHCKFVKNIGVGYDAQELIDNMSYTGGYADDYTDEH